MEGAAGSSLASAVRFVVSAGESGSFDGALPRSPPSAGELGRPEERSASFPRRYELTTHAIVKPHRSSWRCFGVMPILSAHVK